MDMQILHLNVSGREYNIKKSILIKIPYFNNMLETCNDNEIIFVDRSNIVFDHVISFIIDEKHPYPVEYSYELDFYDVKYDITKLYDQNKLLLEKYNDLDKRLIKVQNSSYNSHEKIINNGRLIQKCEVKGCESEPLKSSFLCQKHNDDNQCILNCRADNRCKDLCDNNLSFCNNHTNKFTLCNKRGCDNIKIAGSYFCFLHV